MDFFSQKAADAVEIGLATATETRSDAVTDDLRYYIILYCSFKSHG
jgi:hypothetical protein